MGVKIGSKAIAKRLENVLPHIIHYGQNAIVKGRTIFDATRTISDVLEFTKMRNYQGVMTAIDFEKSLRFFKLELLSQIARILWLWRILLGVKQDVL